MNKNNITNEIVEYNSGLSCHILTGTKNDLHNHYANQVFPVPLHWHNDIEINISFTEELVTEIDGINVTSQKNSFLVINSGSIHGNTKPVKPLPPDAPELLGVCIRISDSFFRRLIPNFDVLEFNTIWHPSTNRPKEIAIELAKYGYPDSTLNKYENIYVSSLMHELVYHLCNENLMLKEKQLSDIEKRNLDCIRNVITYIENNYRNPIDETSLAKKYNFTPTYFSRLFKKYAKIPYKEYLLRTRVAAAKQQLLSTTLSITSIAMDCGFSDVRGLINTFKKYENATPAEFRKMHTKPKD